MADFLYSELNDGIININPVVIDLGEIEVLPSGGAFKSLTNDQILKIKKQGHKMFISKIKLISDVVETAYVHMTTMIEQLDEETGSSTTTLCGILLEGQPVTITIISSEELGITGMLTLSDVD